MLNVVDLVVVVDEGVGAEFHLGAELTDLGECVAHVADEMRAFEQLQALALRALKVDDLELSSLEFTLYDSK